MDKIERLEAHLTGMVNAGTAARDKLIKGLNEHPLHALEWSAAYYADIARREIALHWQGSLAAWRSAKEAGTFAEGQPTNADEVIEFIKTALTREVTRMAMMASQSSSPTANLVERHRLAAQANLLDTIQYY